MTSTEKSTLVDLSPDDRGDRIALVTGGEVSYLPARRFDLGARHRGSAGHCRYLKRAGDGTLYVTGPSSPTARPWWPSTTTGTTIGSPGPGSGRG